MKLNNIFSFGLAALAMASLASCDSKVEPDYKPAGATDDSQRVYFRSAAQSEILDMESTDFAVNVYRYVPETPEGEDQILVPDMSVPVSVSCAIDGIVGGADAAISIGSTAEFTNGDPFAALTAVINDPAKLEGNKTYAIQLAIDPAYANEYAITSMTLNVTREEYTDWALFGEDPALGRDGEGVYTLAQCFTGPVDPTRVMERHVPSNPDAMELEFQWLIDDDQPELGYETFLTANTQDGGKTITVPVQVFTNYPGYGDIYVCDLITYTGDPDSWAPATFDPETGLFSLNVVYWCESTMFGYGYEYCQMKGYKDTNEYSVLLTDQGQINVADTDFSVINFYMSKHVTYVDYTVVEGELDEEQVAQVAETLADSEQTVYQVATIANPAPGKEPYSVNKTFSFDLSGTYTIVAVGYHADASGAVEAKAVQSFVFTYETFNPYFGWIDYKSGALFHDSFVAGLLALYGVEGETEDITVDLEQYEDYPSLYRLTNPYLDSMQVPLYFDLKKFGSIEYQVLESGNVVFPLSGTGIDDGGEWEIMSMAYYYMSGGYEETELPANLFGKFSADEKVLTLDALADDDEYKASFVAAIGNDLYYLNVPFSLSLDGSAAAGRPGLSKKALKTAVKKAVKAGHKLPKKLSDLAIPAHYGFAKSAKALKAARTAAVVRSGRQIVTLTPKVRNHRRR